MAEYIKRDAFIAWLKRIPLKDLSDGLGLCRIIMEEDFKRAIRELPGEMIVDVAPVVHAHFVHDGPRFAGGVDWWHCSNCGKLASGVETRFDYCPFCGARMDGGDDGETD